MRMIFLLLIFFRFGFASDPDQIIREISTSEPLKYGQWSVFVIDAESGGVVADYNSVSTLAPASGLKIVTSAAALSILGEDYQFETVLSYSGKIQNGILKGDIIIHGGGDPSLASPEQPGGVAMDSLLADWSEAIAAAGIREVNGNICGDGSIFEEQSIPDSWQWIDLGNYYGAGSDGLCFHENMYYLRFRPGTRVGEPAAVLRTHPKIPGIEFNNFMATGARGSGDNGYIYGGEREYLRTLRGTIPAGVDSFTIKGSVPDAALLAAAALKNKLRHSGVPVSGMAVSGSAPDGEPIHRHLSPQLKDLVFRLNKKSVNLYAEQFLKMVALRETGSGSGENGVRSVKNWLAGNGITTDGFFMHDGSGLSRLNAVRTKTMAELLAFMAGQPQFEAYYNSFPVAGDPEDEGGIGHLCKGTRAANNVHAKTGYIERVRSHSGYVRTRSGKLLCFSMIANNYTGSLRAVDRMHEKVMIALSELE